MPARRPKMAALHLPARGCAFARRVNAGRSHAPRFVGQNYPHVHSFPLRGVFMGPSRISSEYCPLSALKAYASGPCPNIALINVTLFGVCLNTTSTYSETELRAAASQRMRFNTRRPSFGRRAIFCASVVPFRVVKIIPFGCSAFCKAKLSAPSLIFTPRDFLVSRGAKSECRTEGPAIVTRAARQSRRTRRIPE